MDAMTKATSSPKVIETPYLRVEKNCLEIENTCIQLSNISLFSTADVPKPEIPRVVLFSFLTYCGLRLINISFFIGLAVTVIFGYLVYRWVNDYTAAQKLKCLSIATNSGHTYPIVFSDHEFMGEVMKLMTEIMRNPQQEQVVNIDLKNCHIQSSSFGGNIKNIY